MKIKTAGRLDYKAYFSKGPILQHHTLNHSPLLAFIVEGNELEVMIIKHPKEVGYLPDDTPIMGQWPGNWRSDFFQFNAGDFKEYLAEVKR